MVMMIVLCKVYFTTTTTKKKIEKSKVSKPKTTHLLQYLTLSPHMQERKPR